MSRQRVSKGQIIQKKYQKIASIFLEIGSDANFIDFLECFKTKYHKEWENVNKRYREHEILNGPGKSFPMPRPEKYVEMAYDKVKKELRNKTVDEYLAELEVPEPDFYDGEPKNFKKILLDLEDKSDYEKRILALHIIGKYRSDKTKEVIFDVLENDNIFEVKEIAYAKLVRFGCQDLSEPLKSKPNLDPNIKDKISSLGFSEKDIGDKKRIELLTSKFKKSFPVDYDSYKYCKRNEFKPWLKSVLKQIKL